MVKLNLLLIGLLFISGCTTYDRAACLTLSHNVNSFFYGEKIGLEKTSLQESVGECKEELMEQEGKPKNMEQAILEIEQCLSKKGWMLTQDLNVRKRLC